MNRRGFLLAEETLKIVIAVICIGFLVYLLVSIYMSNKNARDLELAEASLEHLVSEMNSETIEVEIYNPGNPWIVVGWPVEGEIPNQCSNLDWKNCICICKLSWIPTPINPLNIKEVCEEKGRGTCKEIPKKIITGTGEDFYIPLDNPPLTLKLNYQSEEIIITKK